MSDEQQRDHTSSNGDIGRTGRVSDRQSLIKTADEMRCSAERALTLQPFHCDPEAFLWAAEHCVEAAELYGQAGLGLRARESLMEAARCWEHLELREQAERIPVLWEDINE
jgi:hypothetical protein